MLPSGLRPEGAYRQDVWRSYMRAIALGMPGASGQLLDAPILSLWIEAIAQHYGTGSRFLDVTTSLDVALWFALHDAKLETIWEKAKTAAPVLELHHLFNDKVRQISEVPVAWRTVRYSERKDKPGWLYVFDVPRWNGQGEPEHGSLVKLDEAPTMLDFQTSARMNAQSACLLAADSRPDMADLTDLYQKDWGPIPVSWRLAGNETWMKAPANIFPDPADDPWYTLFLSIPFYVRPGRSQFIADPERGEGWLKSVKSQWTRALPVTFYFSKPETKSSSHRDTITSPSNLLDPPLIFSLKLAGVSAQDEANAGFIDKTPAVASKYRLDQSTVIMLESPIISLLPPLDLWNHGLLQADLAEATESFFAREIPSGSGVVEGEPYLTKLTDQEEAEYSKLLSTPFPLTNVFLELSPLEHIQWGKIGNQNVKVLRALWLRHDRKRFVLNPYYQSLPLGTQSSTLADEGPYFFGFDELAQRFAVLVDENQNCQWKPITDLHPACRPFFGALSLLRALSPGPGLEYKIDPFYSRAEKVADQWDFEVAIRSRAAHVVHGSYLPDGRQILSVQGSKRSSHEGCNSNEPYDLLSAPIRDYLTFQSANPWHEVDAQMLRKWVDDNLNFKA